MVNTVAMDFDIYKITMDESVLICAEDPTKAVLLDFISGIAAVSDDAPIDASPSVSTPL